MIAAAIAQGIIPKRPASVKPNQNQGTAETWHCPEGTRVYRIDVWVGSLVEAIQLRCRSPLSQTSDEVPSLHNERVTASPVFGATGGVRCDRLPTHRVWLRAGIGFPAASEESSRVSPPRRPREDGLSHPADTSRSNLLLPCVYVQGCGFPNNILGGLWYSGINLAAIR